jgi:hypothetical protein
VNNAGDRQGVLEEMTTSLVTEAVVYPGHPVVLALCVISRFASYQSAIKVKEEGGCPAALGDIHVPGSGGCVYLALALLKRLRDETPFPQVMEWADQAWGRVDDQEQSDKARWRQGQEQADKLKPVLHEQQKWWAR